MAKTVFLSFEKDLEEIWNEMESFEADTAENGTSHRAEISRLTKKFDRRTSEIYSNLTPWQTALVARHPNRPYTMDYINSIFEDFHELHGDRTYADDESIIGGLARLAERPVMVIGHQKGRDTRERTRRNFGMSRPEGYRKALRLMKLAEKFGLPVFTFIDTPGAYPGIGAEERNQSEAIGRNIFELTKLQVPVVATIIGEGGSGGALAIAVADTVMMLQYSTYSVISPEGCASILWKSAEKASTAAAALGLTGDTLTKLGLVDRIITEPMGGAHRDPKLMASTLKKVLVDQLRKMTSMSIDDLLERRMERLLSYGRFEDSEPMAETTEEETQQSAASDIITIESKVVEDVQEAEVKAESKAEIKAEVKAEKKPAAAKKAPAKKAAAKKATTKPAAKTVAKEEAKEEAKTEVKAPAKKPAAKLANKVAAKTATKTAAKPAAKKAPAKKAPAKKAAPKAKAE